MKEKGNYTDSYKCDLTQTFNFFREFVNPSEIRFPRANNTPLGLSDPLHK